MLGFRVYALQAVAQLLQKSWFNPLSPSLRSVHGEVSQLSVNPEFGLF